ncbi:MAG: hypothetical protein PHH30_04485, partial [Bacteroidales bacterium]|nr:hypothetical protein [Bacteroidales bacterium]
MKNKLYLIFTFLLISIISFSANEDIKNVLLNGKWMNKSDGYFPTPIKPSDDANVKTVSRYKTLIFHEDGTFSMDSAKHEYIGIY